MKVIPAPYGVKTSIVETYNGTTPITKTFTTPLTQSDIQKIQQQEIDVEKQMDQIFVNQQKMFQDTLNGFFRYKKLSRI